MSMSGSEILYLSSSLLLGIVFGVSVLAAIHYRRAVKDLDNEVSFIEIKRHRRVGPGSYSLTKEELLEELASPRFNYLFDSAVSPCGKYIKVSLRIVNNKKDGKY